MGPGYHKCIGVGGGVKPLLPSELLAPEALAEPKTPNARAKWLLPAQTACPKFCPGQGNK